MKKGALIIGALLFSLLFYKQNIGLNQFLFTLLTIGILGIYDFLKLKKKETLIISLAYLISGLTVFYYNTNLNIIINIILFISLIGSYSENRSSIYVKWINGIYSTIISSIYHYYDTLNSEVKKTKKKEINYLHWLKIIGIPIIVLIVFIGLYREGNQLFDDLISKIDLSFINVQWILLAGLGYYLFNNITKPMQIEPLNTNDLNTGNQLIKNSLNEVSTEKLENEKQLGTVLISLLNILIILFLATDIYTLLYSQELKASEYSYFVHSGINALIASIVLAIVIIIYFFRGNLNFYKKNITLKKLTYLWIFLNLILVAITSIKDYQYIISFGFTYKRIGVLIYLFLTFIGLSTTFIKVNKIKNFWYLLRKNTQVAFILLIISTTINWDKIITNYNIHYAIQMDMKYLIELSNNNTLLLKEYSENNTLKSEHQSQIDKKYSEYINDLNDNSWQELCYGNLKFKK